MSENISKFRSGFTYVYLVAFCALLAGIFHPLITEEPFDIEIFGIFILFVGLAGGISLYKSAQNEKRRIIYFAGGFVLIAISLFYIFQITTRV